MDKKKLTHADLSDEERRQVEKLRAKFQPSSDRKPDDINPTGPTMPAQRGTPKGKMTLQLDKMQAELDQLRADHEAGKNLAAPPPPAIDPAEAQREIVLLIDNSGSMERKDGDTRSRGSILRAFADDMRQNMEPLGFTVTTRLFDPQGDTGFSLHEALDAVALRPETKPRHVIVVTDGYLGDVYSDPTPDNPHSQILNATQQTSVDFAILTDTQGGGEWMTQAANTVPTDTPEKKPTAFVAHTATAYGQQLEQILERRMAQMPVTKPAPAQSRKPEPPW